LRARILDGKQIADAMRADLKPEIAALTAKGVQPGLAVVLVGENPASQVYVRMKGRACEDAGMYS
jgi:methylenetetrahydrofolate dehydrogenase (NADP+)/methenyltetrahydrofolate cyclohydrolase